MMGATKESTAKRSNAVRRLEQASTESVPGRLDPGSLRFRLAVLAILVLGTLTVAFIRQDRQYVHPTTSDSYADTLAVFDCTEESFVDPVASSVPTGLRWRSNGTLTVEPLDGSEAGKNATLGRVFSNTGGSLGDEVLTVGDHTLAEAVDGSTTWCRDEEAILQVHRWRAGADDAEVITENLADIRLDAEGDQFIVALAPIGADFEPPAAQS